MRGRLLFPFTAVVRRELVVFLRKRRAFAIAVLFILAGCLAVYAVWPQDTTYMRDAGAASNHILRAVSLVLLAAALLFIPGIAANSLTQERDRDTFDMLRTTLIRPSGVVIGKALNAAGVYFLLMVASVPLLASAFFLLGIDWTQIIRVYAIVFALGAACTCIGVACSSVFRSVYAATTVAYILVFLSEFFWTHLVGSFVGGEFKYLNSLTSLVMSTASPPLSLWVMRLWCLTPLGQLHLIEWGVNDWVAIAGFYVFQAFLCAMGLLVARRFLNRAARPRKVDQEKPVDDPVVLLGRRKHFPYYLFDPLRRKAPIADGRNPILARELRWGAYRHAARAIRLFYATFVVFLVLSTLPVANREDPFAPAFTQFLLLLLVGPGLLGNLFTKEYELGNMDMLRMTPQSSFNIVQGKVAASALLLVPVLAAAFAATIAAAALGWYYYNARCAWLVFAGFITLLVSTAVLLSLNALASTMTRRTVMAIAVTYLMALGLLAALPLTGLVLGWVTREWHTGAFTRPGFLSVFIYIIGRFAVRGSPWLALVQLSEGRRTIFGGRAWWRKLHYVAPETRDAFDALDNWLISLAAALFCALVLLVWAWRRFARMRARDG